MDVTAHQATAVDGTRLSWTSAGAGVPPVVLCDGIGCAGYIWRPLHDQLAQERRVIHWNYRAHGESGAPADPERMTVDDCVSDLVAVLDAAGAEKAVLAGHSMGVQIVLEAHRRAPERVAALVLLCGAPGRLIDTFHDRKVLRTVFPYARGLVLRYPEVARRAFRAVVSTDLALEYAMTFEVDGARVLRSDLARYLDDLARVDPTLFVRLLASAADHDATAHLAQVDVPALVVAGERDAFTPMRLSVDMQRRIPRSELLVVPGGTHVAPLEDPERVGERVRAFLAERAPAPRPRKRRARSAPTAPAPAGAPATPRRKRAAARRAKPVTGSRLRRARRKPTTTK
jgi:pimeloyl-ACP methyl ester carboxylesterase